MVANSACGQLNRENTNFPFPRSRLRVWSRELGSAVPSRVSPLILHTQAESVAYRKLLDVAKSEGGLFPSFLSLL